MYIHGSRRLVKYCTCADSRNFLPVRNFLLHELQNLLDIDITKYLHWYRTLVWFDFNGVSTSA
jgi:hypothetical protein